MYFTDEGGISAVLAVTTIGGDRSISFGAPAALEDPLPAAVAARLQPVPEGTLMAKNGARHVAAVASGEFGCPYGGFAIELADGGCIVFAVGNYHDTTRHGDMVSTATE